MSVKLLAMYKRPADEAAFLQHYLDVHLPLVSKIPGLLSTTASLVDAELMGSSSYFLIAEMRFEDRAAFDAAMSSSENRAAGKDLAGFAKGLVTLLSASDIAD